MDAKRRTFPFKKLRHLHKNQLSEFFGLADYRYHIKNATFEMAETKWWIVKNRSILISYKNINI